MFERLLETVRNIIGNNKAAEVTIGTYYIFDPPVEAAGISTKKIWSTREMRFDRGKYLGFRKEGHVFLGVPIDDPRVASADWKKENPDLRNCFFRADLVVGGSSIEVDPNQNP